VAGGRGRHGGRRAPFGPRRPVGLAALGTLLPPGPRVCIWCQAAGAAPAHLRSSAIRRESLGRGGVQQPAPSAPARRPVRRVVIECVVGHSGWPFKGPPGQGQAADVEVIDNGAAARPAGGAAERRAGQLPGAGRRREVDGAGAPGALCGPCQLALAAAAVPRARPAARPALLGRLGALPHLVMPASFPQGLGRDAVAAGGAPALIRSCTRLCPAPLHRGAAGRAEPARQVATRVHFK